jgi:hypothetical protein
MIPVLECDVLPQEKPPRAIIRVVPGFCQFRKNPKAIIKPNQGAEDIEIDF